MKTDKKVDAKKVEIKEQTAYVFIKQHETSTTKLTTPTCEQLLN